MSNPIRPEQMTHCERLDPTSARGEIASILAGGYLRMVRERAQREGRTATAAPADRGASHESPKDHDNFP